jgi:hypothetical protein
MSKRKISKSATTTVADAIETIETTETMQMNTSEDVIAPFGGEEIIVAAPTADDDDLGDILASISTVEAEPVIADEIIVTAETTDAAVETILDNIAENAALVTAEAAADVVALVEAEPGAVEAVTTTAKKARVAREARVVDRAKFLEAVGAADETTFAARVSGVAKKVREKIDNVADAISSGKRLSNYTRDALAYALANDSAFTVKDLVTMFEGKKYSPGTARAQAQQMGAVFNVLGAADRTGKAFTLKAGPMLDALKEALAPAPTAIAA